MYWMKVSQKKL